MRKMSEDYIGTCQACFGEFKVNEHNKEIVLHGFKRPGIGYTLGQCQGAHHPPFEYDTTVTKLIIKSYENALDEKKKYLVDLNSGLVNQISRMERKYDDFRYVGEHLVEYTPESSQWPQILRNQIANIENLIRYFSRMVAYFQKKLDEWTKGIVIGIDVPATGKERELKNAYDPDQADADIERERKKAERDAKPGKLKVIFYQESVEREFEPGDEKGWRKWLDLHHTQEEKFLADVKNYIKKTFPGKSRVTGGYSSDLPRKMVDSGDYDVVIANLPWEYADTIMDIMGSGLIMYEDEKKKVSYIHRKIP